MVCRAQAACFSLTTGRCRRPFTYRVQPCAPLRKLLSSYGTEPDNVHEEVERPLLVAYPQDKVVDVHRVASQFPVD